MSKVGTKQRSPARLQVANNDSVKGNIKMIEDIIAESQGVLREYKKEVEMLR